MTCCYCKSPNETAQVSRVGRIIARLLIEDREGPRISRLKMALFARYGHASLALSSHDSSHTCKFKLCHDKSFAFLRRGWLLRTIALRRRRRNHQKTGPSLRLWSCHGMIEVRRSGEAVSPCRCPKLPEDVNRFSSGPSCESV